MSCIHSDADRLMQFIAQEPRGAVSNAVCALASLHFTRMRVAQGLEAPDPHPEHSNATYFHNEASFQLDTAKQLRGRYSESDAIAALHLVSFTQLAGGTKDWQPAFSVVAEWLSQTGLPASDDPAMNLRAMSPIAQLVVRGALVSVNKFDPRSCPDLFVVAGYIFMYNSSSTS
jgi:hypothetical protein